MNIQVLIQLEQNEYAADLAGNATEIAEAVLKAAGGDEDKDTCHVTIHDLGTAGSVPKDTPMPPFASS